MVIQSSRSKKKNIKANSRKVRRSVRANRKIQAEDEVEEAGVNVAPEASDLLFEAEDVAELVAEITGEEVAVTAEDDTVTFEIGEDQFVVEAEGNEEILESTKIKNKNAVRASRRVNRARRARRR